MESDDAAEFALSSMEAMIMGSISLSALKPTNKQSTDSGTLKGGTGRSSPKEVSKGNRVKFKGPMMASNTTLNGADGHLDDVDVDRAMD